MEILTPEVARYNLRVYRLLKGIKISISTDRNVDNEFISGYVRAFHILSCFMYYVDYNCTSVFMDLSNIIVMNRSVQISNLHKLMFFLIFFFYVSVMKNLIHCSYFDISKKYVLSMICTFSL